MFSYACPRCNKILRSSLSVAAGKTLTCPGCRTSFTITEHGISTATKVTQPATSTFTFDDDEPTSALQRSSAAPINQRAGGRGHLLIALGALAVVVAGILAYWFFRSPELD